MRHPICSRGQEWKREGKSWHFEANEDSGPNSNHKLSMSYFRNKYWNTDGSDNPSLFIPFLLNIGVLLHKQATHAKHLKHSMTRAQDLLQIFVQILKKKSFNSETIRLKIVWEWQLTFQYHQVLFDFTVIMKTLLLKSEFLSFSSILFNSVAKTKNIVELIRLRFMHGQLTMHSGLEWNSVPSFEKA